MPITEEQREYRKRGLGSSDMAALFHLDPYKNAGDVYLDKTGQLPPLKPTQAMRLGTLLEGYVLDWAEGRYVQSQDEWPGVGPLDRDVGTIELSGDHVMANVDAVVKQDGAPVEAKTHWLGQTRGDWGPDGSDQVPDHVNIQLHTQMLCIGADYGHVAALLGRGMARFFVHRDEAVCDAILATAKSFWEEHVIPRVPPPDVLPQLDTLKRVIRTPEKRVPVSCETLVQWLECKTQRQAHEIAENTAKAKLLTALGDAELGDPGEDFPLVTYLRQNRTGFDTKRFQADHPDLFAEYKTTTTFPVLRTKKR